MGMTPTVLYIACLIGAVGLYLMLRPAGVRGAAATKGLGGLLDIVAFGYIVVAAGEMIGGDARPTFFYLLFSAIALAAAVKMITTSRPVYSALFFVLVVLSSAGLFLLLAAEFMAFALIIVYAGAILITYMFVLMLAQQSPDPRAPEGRAEYDRVPREPASGAIVGFILIALLSRMVIEGAPALPPPPSEAEARIERWESLRLMPGRVEREVGRLTDHPAEIVLDADGMPRLEISPDGRTAVAYYDDPDRGALPVELPPTAMPENVQLVGLGLVRTFPVSLELAGVILLLAMFGAVLLARRQIELSEDEKREAAGMGRLGHHDEPASTTTGGEGGAAP
jgi:NADH-quinone oxidoreductase subunit J